MVNLLIAFDDNDSSLADYFQSSHQFISDLVAVLNDINLFSIPGLNCTENHISDTVGGLNGQSFLFVGFSHGNSEQLLTDNEVYVSINNCAQFTGSVFYSTGCETALVLGGELVNQGCLAFIGYYDDSLATFDQFSDVYIECENHALKLFMTEDVTYGEAFDLMIDKFDEEIQKMFDANEILMAMELINNKDCFGIQGDENVKFQHLHF